MTTKKAKVPKNKPLPKKKADPGTGGAGKAALAAIATTSRGRSKVLCDSVKEIMELRRKKRELSLVERGVNAKIKGAGFSMVAVRHCIKLLEMEPDDRANLEENIAIAKEGLGMQLSLFDKQAMGEEPTEAELDAKSEARADSPDPEAIAMQRASASSIEPVH